MNFDDLWNNKIKYISGTDYQLCKFLWELFEKEIASNNENFDSWWEYHGTKNFMKSNNHAARWAWIIQQTKIDKLLSEIESLKNQNIQ